MSRRNLNEVLGFISRWGDSRFSSKCLSEVLSPDQIRELGERDPKNKLKLIQLAKSREERLSKLQGALDDPKKFRSATFDPTTGKVVKSRGFLTKQEMAKRQIRATGILGRVGNDMEKITDIDLPTFTKKDLSTKSRTATPADMKEIKAILDKEKQRSDRKNINIQSGITAKTQTKEKESDEQQELINRIQKLRKPGFITKISTATGLLGRGIQGMAGLAAPDPKGQVSGVRDVMHAASDAETLFRQGRLQDAMDAYNKSRGRAGGRIGARVGGLSNYQLRQLALLINNK